MNPTRHFGFYFMLKGSHAVTLQWPASSFPCCLLIWCSPLYYQSFAGGSGIKNPPANAGYTRDVDSIPGLRRSPGEGNGNPLQYSCHGVTELDKTEHTHTHTRVHLLVHFFLTHWLIHPGSCFWAFLSWLLSFFSFARQAILIDLLI